MSFVHTGPLPFLWALAILLVCVAAACRMGEGLIGVAGIPIGYLSGSERLLASAGVGLLFLSLAVLVIGLCGFLSVYSAAAIVAVFISLPAILKTPSPEISRLSELRNGKDGWVKFSLSLGIAVMTVAALQCGLPPTGNDALAYHLASPKLFVLDHKIAFLPEQLRSLWPFNTEMLFTLGLLLQGTTLAQLFHWLFYPLTAAAVFAFTSRFFGPRSAAFAFLVFVFTPVVFAQSSEAYVDLSLAFFIFMAVYAFVLKEGSALPEARAALLSGLFCGAAAGTKFLGLGAGLVLFVFWLAAPKARFKNAAVFTAAAAAASAIWYLRSWHHLGNPVYPFFSDIFGAGYEFGIDEGVGMGRAPLRFVALLWNMTMKPDTFGGPLLGALYLMFLPAAALLTRRPRRTMGYFAVFALVFSFFLFNQAQQVRFFIAALPFFAVGCGFALKRLSETGARPLVMAVFGLAVFLQGMLLVYRTRDSWPALACRQSAEEYLLDHERSFLAYDYLIKNVPADAAIFNTADWRSFYNERPNLLLDTYDLRYSLKRQGMTIREFLKKEKFDYVWTEKTSDQEVLRFLRENGYDKVFSYSFEEAPAVYDYEIYRRIS